MRALALVMLVAACATPDNAPTIEKVRPPWGPTSGGTVVLLLGDNFDPYVNRVFVGGREAPLVRTLDEQHLEVVIPPGERAGDAEIMVVTPTDNAIGSGVFRYSEPPSIDSVSPTKVLLSELPTTISLHGRGFADEEAGAPIVLVDGRPPDDVTVRSDSLITFDAPAGVAFSRANIELVNQRGSTSARGYVHAVSDRPGLILYATSGESSVFAWFYEPVAAELLAIPRSGTSRPCLYSAMTSATGAHVASAYCLEFPYAYARVELATQNIVDLVPTNLYYAMTRHENENYGVDLGSRRFGTFADDGTGFVPRSALLPGFQFGLASDRGTLYLAGRDAASVPSISTIDPQTGMRGALVPLQTFLDVNDMVAHEGVIYAVTSDGRLVTIDPTTGLVTPLVTFGQSYAMDVIE